MANKELPGIHFIMKRKVPLHNRRKLRRQLLAIFNDRQRTVGEINYLFCSDEEILEANQQFLGHHYATDIITFDHTGTNGDPIVSDIIIGVDTVRTNAVRYNQPLERELHRVLFHGALHLCGLNDKTPAERRKMREMEEHYLSMYFGA